MPFLIQAMVQSLHDLPYQKISYISNNPSVEIHMSDLNKIYHRVLSVKSRPADEVELGEFMHDTQGNMNSVDGVPVDAEADTISKDSSTD